MNHVLLLIYMVHRFQYNEIEITDDYGFITQIYNEDEIEQ
mgnify:CR=1 FL=1